MQNWHQTKNNQDMQIVCRHTLFDEQPYNNHTLKTLKSEHLNFTLNSRVQYALHGYSTRFTQISRVVHAYLFFNILHWSRLAVCLQASVFWNWNKLREDSIGRSSLGRHRCPQRPVARGIRLLKHTARTIDITNPKYHWESKTIQKMASRWPQKDCPLPQSVKIYVFGLLWI